MHLYELLELMKTVLSTTAANSLERQLSTPDDCKTNDECFGVWTESPPRTRVYTSNTQQNDAPKKRKRTMRGRVLLQKVAFWLWFELRCNSVAAADATAVLHGGDETTSCSAKIVPRAQATIQLVNRLVNGDACEQQLPEDERMKRFLTMKNLRVRSTCSHRATPDECDDSAVKGDLFYCLNPAHLRVSVSPSTRRRINMPVGGAVASAGRRRSTEELHSFTDYRTKARHARHQQRHSREYASNAQRFYEALHDSAAALQQDADDDTYETTSQYYEDDSRYARSTTLVFVDDPDNPDDPFLKEVSVSTQADLGLAQL